MIDEQAPQGGFLTQGQPGAQPAPQAPGAQPAPQAPGAQPAPQAPGAQPAPQAGGQMPPGMEEALKMASKILYDEKVFNSLAEQAQSDPVEALSTTVLMIMDEVEAQYGNMDIDGVFTLLVMSVLDGADALQQGGVQVDQNFVTQVIEITIQMWLQAHPKRFSKEQIEEAVASMPDEGLSGGDVPPGAEPQQAGGFLSQMGPGV